MRWLPFIELSIDKQGTWRLKRAMREAFGRIYSRGIWDCFTFTQPEKRNVTLRKRDAILVILRFLVDILEALPEDGYRALVASSKSTTSDKMWDGERYAMPS